MTIEWIVGVSLSLAAIVGGVIVRDRQVMRQIAAGDSKCHDRINEVKEKYVMRDSIRTEFAELKTELRETNRRLDVAIFKLNEKP